MNADSDTRGRVAASASAARDAPGADAGGRPLVLEGRHLTRAYRLPAQRLFERPRAQHALHDVSITIRADETLALIGESGSGKSTLVRLLLGLEPPTSGEVRIDGQPLAGRQGGGRGAGHSSLERTLRRRTGLVLQDPYASLDPRMTVRQTLAEPLGAQRIPGDREALVQATLRSVGLEPWRADQYPHELSGGQRQRVAIGRAIIHEPELLVGDEPLSALDLTIRAQILGLLARLRRERGLGLLLVSHDIGLVAHIADRICVMRAGRVIETGPTDEVLGAPRQDYTRRLLAAVPRLPRV